jgi:endonuclease G
MPTNNPLDNLNPVQRVVIGAVIVLVGAVVALVHQYQDRPAAPTPAPPGEPGEPGTTLANRNVRFGMPADAKTDPASADAYLIERPQYALSYNDAKRTPNWVCWNLTADDIGQTKRAAAFEPDPDLPGGFRHVTSADYNGSGFDRGHMCPSKDRSDSEANNRATFYTTNIVPQSPKCNRGGWERFEDHCRHLTGNGSELFIAAGPSGQGGTGEHGERATVGRGGAIVVPAAVWKVVLVVPEKGGAPTTAARTLAVWMPNDQTVTTDWKQYAVTVAEVERRTGYRFFPLVPEDVAAAIKGRPDRGP